MILCKKQFRWVAHLSQSSLQHLIDAQFRSTSESVLDASQDAIHIMLVTLKLDNGIHNMLQNLRSRQGSFLIDMSYQDNRNATGLGKTEKMGCTFTDLRYRTRRTVHLFGSDGLDRVDDDEFRSHLLDMREDFLQLRFTEYRNMIEGLNHFLSPQQRLSLSQSVGTQLNLMGTLLTADVENTAVGHIQNGLQSKCTLADTRFTTQQGDASRNHSSTQYAVQFLIAHIDARFINGRDVAQLHRLGIIVTMLTAEHSSSTAMSHRHAGILSRLRATIARNANLLESVPLSATWAFTHPLGTFLSTVATNVCYFILCHKCNIYSCKSTAFFSSDTTFLFYLR